MMTALRSWPTWSKQLFQAEPAAGGTGGCFVVSWLVDSLYPPPNCGSWENISLPTLAPTLKRSFSWSGKRSLAFFFFSLELPSSHLWMESRMCSAQKCTFWQLERSWTDDIQGPERLLRTSAVSDLDVPTTYHKCVSWVFKSLSLRTVRMPQQRPVSARTSTSVPRTRSSFSAFAFTVTHIVKLTGKGATTTLPIPSPSHPCSRRRDRWSKLRKARRTKHENKESISI